MSTIKKQITVELSVNAEFFQDWLDYNEPDAEHDSLSDALFDHFKNHLEYQIDGADKDYVPYCATIVGYN